MGTTWHFNSARSDEQQAVRDAHKAAEKVEPGCGRRTSGYSKAAEDAFFKSLAESKAKGGR